MDFMTIMSFGFDILDAVADHLDSFFYCNFLIDAEIAQVVERRPEKPGVPSASLGLGTLLRSNVFTFELRSSF